MNVIVWLKSKCWIFGGDWVNFFSTGRRKIFCQQCLVAVKEGETLLLEHGQDDNCFMEAGMEIDEVSLYRWGGFALHSAIKVFEYGKETSGTRQAVCDVFIIEYRSHGWGDDCIPSWNFSYNNTPLLGCIMFGVEAHEVQFAQNPSI